MVNNLQTSGRDTFLDTCKYLLIILVIAGHFLESYKHLHWWMEYLYSFIYLFHMPFFVFISGYFSKHVTVKKLINSTFLLLETFIVLQVGFLWLRDDEWTEWRAIFSPWYAPWYLLSLIWWRWAAWFCLQINRPGICLSAAIIIGICSGFLNGNAEPTCFLALARTCIFLPFFIAGLYCTPERIRTIRQWSQLRMVIPLLIIVLSLTLFYGKEFNLIEYGNGFHWNEVSPVESLRLFGERLYFLLSASILIVCFLNLLPTLRSCSGFGSRTMFFFSYHIFFIILFNYNLRRWWHIAHPDWWYPLACIILTVICLNLLSRFTIFTRLLNPVTSLIRFLHTRGQKK